MKKLLVTASTFPRWKNDTEPRFILDYAKAMTKYYEVHVLVPMAPGAAEEEDMEGVHVHRFHYFPVHKWETLCYPGAIVPRIKEKKIRIFLVPFLLINEKRAIRKYSAQVDIVHAHWLIPQGILQAGVKKTPYIVTGHGGDVTSLNVPVIKRLKYKCLGNARAVIGVSEHICDKIRQLNPETHPHMISMGCDLSKFSPAKRLENVFPHDKKNILFVGRLAEKKGVAYLIEAMKEIDARLFIVGKGPLEDSLKNQAAEFGDRIIFMGAKSHEELPALMASADVFCAPSIVARDGDQEGLPVSIMEAMASGLPVVAGISGGTGDIVHNGENGFIVDATDTDQLAEKINTILTDTDLQKKMGKNALTTAQEYSYCNICERYQSILSGYEC